MISVKRREKPIQLGPVWSVLFFPLLLVAGALSIPYALIAGAMATRRERRFTNLMKVNGRTMDWADFIREISNGHGTLIVEQFSFKGPTRMWWTTENLYEACPYPLADWFTMTKDASFDAVRQWCHARYTSAAGDALLVLGTREQWRTIRADAPLTFRDDVRYLEVPPPRRSP